MESPNLQATLLVLRTGQLFYQFAHHTVATCAFFADHAFFGAAYTAYAEAFDQVAERALGLGHKPDLADLNIAAAKMAAEISDGNLFTHALELEQALLKVLAEAQGISTGTDNLTAGIADAVEARIYQLRQRQVG